MFRSGIISVTVISIVAGSLFAGPRIAFDTTDYQCGNIAEGIVDTVQAVFNVKNVGDAVLKLREVRPSCGCTVVRYDSVIQPGQSAKIFAAVKIAGYHPGAYTKMITVTSNSEKDSVERLRIEINIQPIIEISATYLDFNKNDTAKSKILILVSKKADLKVSKVFFGPLNYAAPAHNAPMPDSAKKFMKPVKYVWTPTDSIRSDGFRVFKIAIFRPKIDSIADGRIIMLTNHPDFREIVLQSNVGR